jgi:hypothetical protein
MLAQENMTEGQTHNVNEKGGMIEGQLHIVTEEEGVIEGHSPTVKTKMETKSANKVRTPQIVKPPGFFFV